MKLKYQIYLPVIISTFFVLGMLFGYGIRTLPVDSNSTWTKASKEKRTLSEVIGLIDQNYFEEQESADFVDAAIFEIFESLDPHSMYIPPYHSEMLEVSNSGKYRGIGIETLDIDSDIYISNVIKGSPADSVHILKGSRVLNINSIDIKENRWNADSLSHYLKDKDEENIKFNLDHFSYDEPRVVDVVPAEVKILNIAESFEIIEEVGYIRISKFGNDSYKDFMQSLEGLVKNDSLNNLIIDLRDNPGGYLQEVCKIISQILPERTAFLTTVDADGRSKPYRSIGQSFFYIGNIIVLIDKESASASEILAGVLQDMDRAIIVGEESYGKGLVQEQFKLSNGGVARLSVSRYKLPSGRFIGQSDSLGFESLLLNRSLNSTGKIQPDFELKHEFSVNNMNIFKAAVKALNAKSIDVDFETYHLLNDSTDINLKYEKALIRYENDMVLKYKALSDDVINKSLELLNTKDEWGILK